MALTPDRKTVAAATSDGRGTFIFKFGGGLNSQQIPSEINDRECADGQNFDLPDSNAYFRPRRAIKLVAQATNGQAIRGGVQLIKSDGTRSFLIQAGDTVYQWGGASTSDLTVVARVSPAARLRGKIESNSIKDDKVLIADLNQIEPVLQWDGTTFKRLVHDLTGDFYARYITIWRERAVYANVKATSTLPHVVVFSRRSDTADFSGTLTIQNRPSSSLAARDPFFLSMQNLAPIRGFAQMFGRLGFATKAETWFTLDGDDATNHALSELYTGATGSGDEEVEFVGNDLVFGKQGGIDTLSATERFGSVQSDDLTRWIHDEVKEIPSWQIIYSPRFERVYCVPLNGGKIYVLHKGLLDQRVRAQLFGASADEVSPWSKWTTTDSFNFEPTFAMRMLNPSDGLEYVYMGDRSGKLWQLEGNTATDNGSSIAITRTTKPIRIPTANYFKIDGWVRSRKVFQGDILIQGLVGGKQIFDTAQKTVSILNANGQPSVWNGSSLASPPYWGSSSFWWGLAFNGRMARNNFTLEGQAEDLQLKITVNSNSLAEFYVEEIGIQVEAQSASVKT